MNKKTNWRQFINFWKEFYYDPKSSDDKLYWPFIGKKITEKSLDCLWQWKMGPYFNRASNQRALHRMKGKVDVLNNFRDPSPIFAELFSFSRKFFRNGVVYSVFLMHICKPDYYPIFDQHAFRSFVFLTTGQITKIVPDDIEDYKKYRNFVLTIHKQCGLNLRDIDKALMAFGQFLKNPKNFFLSC